MAAKSSGKEAGSKKPAKSGRKEENLHILENILDLFIIKKI